MTEEIRFLGSPVYSLQTMLRAISAVEPQVLPVIPDGTYGPNTYGSVLSFQQRFHLPRTGTADYATWTRIVAEYEKTAPRQRGTFPFLPVEPSALCASEILLLQAALLALSRQYQELTPPPLTGLLDHETAAALQWVQRTALLPQTGVPDPMTQVTLLGIYRNSVF